MAEKQIKLEKEAKNVQVFIRIRPFSEHESSYKTCIQVLNDKQITLPEKEGAQRPIFAFDKIFSTGTSQEEVYETVAPNIIQNVFQGVNGTIFCYGQTSSGKTYTCIGSDFMSQQKRGILPRTIQKMLQKIQSTPKNIQCKMKISMVEIYNEKIKDLLDQSKNDLKIRSNKNKGIFIADVTQKYILTQEESQFFIGKGIQNRSVGSTNMNIHSSRSHMVFIITLHQHDFYTGEARVAKLTLVDLAGCQKISRTGSEGRLLEEAKKINTSLSVLGKVINALSEGKKTHIPYRDSKLTRLLQESLGGNCITNLIINVSPDYINESETLISLRFGSRAKAIKNQPYVNKQYTVPELLDLLAKAQQKIKDQNEMIEQLMRLKGCNGFTKSDLLEAVMARKQARQHSDENPHTRKQEYSNFLCKEDSECYTNAQDPELTGSTFLQGHRPRRNNMHSHSFSTLNLFKTIDMYPAIKKSASQLSVNSHNKTGTMLGETKNTPLFNPKVSPKLDSPESEAEEEEYLFENGPMEIVIKNTDGYSETQKKSICFLSLKTVPRVFDLLIGSSKIIQMPDNGSQKTKQELSRQTACKSDSQNPQEELDNSPVSQFVGVAVQQKCANSALEDLQRIRENLLKIKALRNKR